MITIIKKAQIIFLKCHISPFFSNSKVFRHNLVRYAIPLSVISPFLLPYSNKQGLVFPVPCSTAWPALSPLDQSSLSILFLLNANLSSDVQLFDYFIMHPNLAVPEHVYVEVLVNELKYFSQYCWDEIF